MFRDRAQAGRRLASALRALRGDDVVVVGLAHGGVPVAREVADRLGAPLDVLVVRKLGVPFQSEWAMGAIGEDDVLVVNPEVVHAAGLTQAEFAALVDRERAELDRLVHRLRHGRRRVPLAGRTVVVVDDGVATGSTARAGCAVARATGACRVVLAVPIAPKGSSRTLADSADEVVCLAAPAAFRAVGDFYDDFGQVTDEQVGALLALAAASRASH
jgi:putative phosphoribosyl transferase